MLLIHGGGRREGVWCGWGGGWNFLFYTFHFTFGTELTHLNLCLFCTLKYCSYFILLFFANRYRSLCQSFTSGLRGWCARLVRKHSAVKGLFLTTWKCKVLDTSDK